MFTALALLQIKGIDETLRFIGRLDTVVDLDHKTLSTPVILNLNFVQDNARFPDLQRFLDIEAGEVGRGLVVGRKDQCAQVGAKVGPHDALTALCAQDHLDRLFDLLFLRGRHDAATQVYLHGKGKPFAKKV